MKVSQPPRPLIRTLFCGIACLGLGGCPSPAERAARVSAQNKSLANTMEFATKMGAELLIDSLTNDPVNPNQVNAQLSQAWSDLPAPKQQQKKATWTKLWRQIVKANPASDQEAELVLRDPPPRMPDFFRMGK